MWEQFSDVMGVRPADVTPFMDVVMGFLKRRWSGEKPGRAGQARRVALDEIQKIPDMTLWKLTRVFEQGFVLNKDPATWPASFRQSDVYQNNGTRTEPLHPQQNVLFGSYKKRKGIYIVQIVCRHVPPGKKVPVAAVEHLQNLSLSTTKLRAGDRGKKDVGKSRAHDFGSRSRGYNTPGGNKIMERHMHAAMEAWPGLILIAEMLPLWVAPAGTNTTKDDDPLYVLMECIGDALTHSGPTPGDRYSAAAKSRMG
jgi:hypothetical protein